MHLNVLLFHNIKGVEIYSKVVFFCCNCNLEGETDLFYKDTQV